jgi:hypothetical protein
VIFFNSKTKSFLKIHKAELISQEIVLVDPTYKGILPAPNQILSVSNPQNPFDSLANLLVLKTIMGEIDGFKVPHSSQFTQDFVFGDIYFSYNFFPPRFGIKRTSSDEKPTKIKDIAQKIVSLGSLTGSLGAVGFNYEFKINNEDEKINIRDIVCNASIAKEFDQVSVTLASKEEGATLNLQIADAAEIGGKKVIYIAANFHNEITSTTRFDNILEKDFMTVINRKLEIIFP